MIPKTQIEHRLDCMKQQLLSQKKALAFCFLSVFFWGLAAHGYGFSHNSLSHDVLNAFVATSVENTWKIELGRFVVPVYRAVFRGSVSLPWLIGLLGLSWTALSLYLITRIFSMDSRILTFLTAGILTTNITMIAQVATYVYEYDVNCFALLLAVLAVWLWNRGKGILCILGAGICLALSIGTYQAYFAVAVTLIVCKSILDLLEGQQAKSVFFRGLRGIGMLLLGGILYLLVSKLVYSMTDVVLQGRTDALDTYGENPIALYLGMVKPALLHVFRNIFHISYSGRMVLFAVFFALLALLALDAVRMFIAKKYPIGSIGLLLLLAAVLPFAMGCVYFMAKGEKMHDLTNFALWLFYVFLLLLAFRMADKDMRPVLGMNILRAAACLLVGVILWQNVVLANTAYIKKELEADQALSTMTRVVSMLEQQEDYIYGQTPVTFISEIKQEPAPLGMEKVAHITGLHSHEAIPLDDADYYYNVYKAYFDYVLRYPLQFCPDDVHKALKVDPRVQALPEFPDRGCMEMIDGVMVIKMW